MNKIFKEPLKSSLFKKKRLYLIKEKEADSAPFDLYRLWWCISVFDRILSDSFEWVEKSYRSELEKKPIYKFEKLVESHPISFTSYGDPASSFYLHSRFIFNYKIEVLDSTELPLYINSRIYPLFEEYLKGVY